jgi:hypothetical protein
MRSILEASMIICFGMSWPVSVFKTYKTKKVEGKSLFFLILICIGYIFGIVAKLLYSPDYVTIFYFINLLFVGIDILLLCRYRVNKKLLNVQ